MSNLRKNYSYEYKNVQKFFKNILIKQRKKFYKIFCKLISINENYKILDVGASNTDNNYDNFLLHYYPFKNNISCLSNQTLDLVKKKYPEIEYFVGDGREMSLSSNIYDIVFSNAVLEHVGSSSDQLKFVRDCVRVSKKYVFIITPYRYFPIEMHTKIPLIHFLPKKIFRQILILFGENFLSKEENLNLLSKNDLLKICNKLIVKKFEISYSYFLGFRSNMILKIEK